jgi:hypothetical protein
MSSSKGELKSAVAVQAPRNFRIPTSTIHDTLVRKRAQGYCCRGNNRSGNGREFTVFLFESLYDAYAAIKSFKEFHFRFTSLARKKMDKSEYEEVKRRWADRHPDASDADSDDRSSSSESEDESSRGRPAKRAKVESSNASKHNRESSREKESVREKDEHEEEVSVGTYFASLYDGLDSAAFGHVDLTAKLLSLAKSVLPAGATDTLMVKDLPKDARLREVEHVFRTLPGVQTIEPDTPGRFKVVFESAEAAFTAFVFRNRWFFEDTGRSQQPMHIEFV